MSCILKPNKFFRRRGLKLYITSLTNGAVCTTNVLIESLQYTYSYENH